MDSIDARERFEANFDALLPIDTSQHHDIWRRWRLWTRSIRLYHHAVGHIEEAPTQPDPESRDLRCFYFGCNMDCRRMLQIGPFDQCHPNGLDQATTCPK